MSVHCFVHVPFEGIGSIAPWLEGAGYEITTTRFFDFKGLPEQDEIETLIVMGGPMSVNDEADCPWLVDEVTFIKETIAAGKPVLGICLGAQLIASALGARVYPNEQREIGWFTIQGLPDTGHLTFPFPQSENVFHWHGETFELPAGAIRLAESAGCKNQAFQVGSSVIGLQFHLETTPESAQKLVENCRDELVQGEYIQTEEQILSASPEMYESIHGLMGEILSYLLQSPKV